MTEDIKNKLSQIKLVYDNNANLFEEYKKLINEASELIFKEYCQKPYLNRCEPEFCSIRILGECKYFEELNNLHAIINQ
jgi:hypothetical protein